MLDDLDVSTLKTTIDQPPESTKEKLNSLVIIDDFGAALKDNEIQRQLNELIWNRRHLRTSIWILILSFISVPIQLRKADSYITPYKPRNKVEIHNIFEELVQLTTEIANSLSRFIFDVKYNIMILDCTSGEIYKKLTLSRWTNTMPVHHKKASKSKPRKITPKKKTTTRKERAPINRNTNSVRVHIINGGIDGGSAPPPYAGPNRSYFAFTPVFDMGLQKASNQPPMNTGDHVSAGHIKPAAEIPTQVASDRGLFDTFLSITNSSMSMGSGLEIGQSSREMLTDSMMED